MTALLPGERVTEAPPSPMQIKVVNPRHILHFHTCCHESSVFRACVRSNCRKVSPGLEEVSQIMLKHSKEQTRTWKICGDLSKVRTNRFFTDKGITRNFIAEQPAWWGGFCDQLTSVRWLCPLFWNWDMSSWLEKTSCTDRPGKWAGSLNSFQGQMDMFIPALSIPLQALHWGDLFSWCILRKFKTKRVQ